MQPKLQLLMPELVQWVLDEAFQLLRSPGVKVQSAGARELLAQAGAQVNESREVVSIPETVARQAAVHWHGCFSCTSRSPLLYSVTHMEHRRITLV